MYRVCVCCVSSKDMMISKLMGSASMKAVAATAARYARGYASLASGTDIVSLAEGLSLQKACSWDEAISSNFATTPVSHIFEGKKVVIFGLPGAYTGVCSSQHVPSYRNNLTGFKGKGIDSIVCVAVNDPYTLNAWAEKIQANAVIDFYGDFDGSFHKRLDLGVDLSAAFLGPRCHRWSAYVDDGKIKAFNLENAPSEFKVSNAETLLAQI